MSNLVIQAASVFLRYRVKNRETHRQIEVKTVPPSTAISIITVHSSQSTALCVGHDLQFTVSMSKPQGKDVWERTALSII